jgi:hypothetical protein
MTAVRGFDLCILTVELTLVTAARIGIVFTRTALCRCRLQLHRLPIPIGKRVRVCVRRIVAVGLRSART